MAELTPERRALLERKKELLEKRKQALKDSGFELQSESAPRVRTNAGIAGTAKGVAGLLGLPIDTVTNAINLAMAGYGTLATAAGRPDLAPDLIEDPIGGSQSISRGFNKLGINTENPRPEDPLARAAHTGGVVLGSSALPVKATTIRAGFRPVETAVSAGSAGGTAALTDDPNLIGAASIAPSLTGAVTSRATQLALSKTQAGKNVKQNLETFKQAGTDPSLGQATESPFLLALEDVFQKLPGGHRPLLGKFSKQQEQIGASAGRQGSAEAAGRAIEKGVESFKGRTSKVWKDMDTVLRDELGPDARVAPSKTFIALDEVAAPLTGVEKSSKALVSDKLTAFRSGLEADMAGKTNLPVEGLRQLRSRVGDLMDSASTDISRGSLKRIYGALSEDLKEAAIRSDALKAAAIKQTGVGQPGKAVRTWERQNRYWKARTERIDTALDKVLGTSRTKMPEDIFAATAPKNVEQVNLLRQVMRSLSEDERQVVSKAIIGRLGRAPKGQQSDVGDVFSTTTFLGNWNNISASAKVQIIPNAATRNHLDAIAKTSFRIKETSKTGQQFAGRFGSLSQVIFAGVIGGALYKGGLSGAVGAATLGVGGIRVTGNLMTNDKFVAWLGQSSKPVDPQRYAQRLAVIYNTSDEQTQSDLADFMTSVNELMESRQTKEP